MPIAPPPPNKKAKHKTTKQQQQQQKCETIVFSEFFLGVTVVPREIEDKFLGVKKVHYGLYMWIIFGELWFKLWSM